MCETLPRRTLPPATAPSCRDKAASAERLRWCYCRARRPEGSSQPLVARVSLLRKTTVSPRVRAKPRLQPSAKLRFVHNRSRRTFRLASDQRARLARVPRSLLLLTRTISNLRASVSRKSESRQSLVISKLPWTGMTMDIRPRSRSGMAAAERPPVDQMAVQHYVFGVDQFTNRYPVGSPAVVIDDAKERRVADPGAPRVTQDQVPVDQPSQTGVEAAETSRHVGAMDDGVEINVVRPARGRPGRIPGRESGRHPQSRGASRSTRDRDHWWKGTPPRSRGTRASSGCRCQGTR